VGRIIIVMLQTQRPGHAGWVVGSMTSTLRQVPGYGGSYGTKFSISAGRYVCGLNAVQTVWAWQKQQINSRLHFTRAMHSRHPFPADPIFSKRDSDGMIPCAAWRYWRSLLQPARNSALSTGKKNPSGRPAMRPIVNMPYEDRATDMGNMHKNLVKIARVAPEISCRTDRQTDRQTHTHQNTSQPLTRAK